MSGFIDAGGERVSDLLAKQPVLRISDETDTWTSIAVEDLIVVAPPTHASTRRVHRAKRRITLSAPPYEVTGTVHLPPGTQLDPFMVRTGQRVLAVTNPWIHDVERGEEHYPPVAIVLVPAISWARELIGPA